MLDYKDTLLYFMNTFRPVINPGEALIYIWRDQDHYNCTSDDTSDIRFLRVSCDAVSHIKTMYKKEDITMGCIGFGKQEDNSDLVIVYFMEFTLTKTGIPPRLDDAIIDEKDENTLM